MVHRLLDASWNGTECQVDEPLAEVLEYPTGPVTVSLPREDDTVLGYTRSITLEITSPDDFCDRGADF